MEEGDIPRFLLGYPKVRRFTGMLAEADVVIVAADELVSQRLETGEKEGGGGGEVGDGEGEMGDRHVDGLAGSAR